MSNDLTVAKAGKPSPRKNAHAQMVLDKIGVDGLLERVANGDSLQQIGASLGMSRMAVSEYLDRFADSGAYARARKDAAEAWAERAWQCLQLRDEEIDMPRVNLARHKEAHCMKRAAIADARYSDKASVELTGANGGPIQSASLVTVYIPANGRDERVIEPE